MCLFCDLLAGRTPASFVHRDEVCTAFMDIQPVNAGHVLVVPNRHATGLSDLPADTGAHLFRVAHRLSQALRHSGVRCEGVNLFLADGRAAMQEVFHVHLHVIPRFEGDGFGLRLPPSYHDRPPRSDLERLAGQVAAALGR